MIWDLQILFDKFIETKWTMFKSRSPSFTQAMIILRSKQRYHIRVKVGLACKTNIFERAALFRNKSVYVKVG